MSSANIDEDICDFCTTKFIDGGDSCVNCERCMCDDCMESWLKMIVLKKCIDFCVYGDHNRCIKCVYGIKDIPVLTEQDEKEYALLTQTQIKYALLKRKYH
jgi:hypothetical protein